MATNPFTVFRAFFFIGFCLLGTIAILTQPEEAMNPSAEEQVNQEVLRDLKPQEKAAALQDAISPDDSSKVMAFSE